MFLIPTKSRGLSPDTLALLNRKSAMITLEEFNDIKAKYGKCASWAIWADQEERPKDNIGDLSVLDPKNDEKRLSEFKLNPNIVFVGLNLSRGNNECAFANFHSKDSKATDFKIRFAFKDSSFWGGYMTDIIKGCVEKNSTKVEKHLRKNKEFERQSVKDFCQELGFIGAIDPTLIAFGTATYKILMRNLEILKKHSIAKDKIKKIIIMHIGAEAWVIKRIIGIMSGANWASAIGILLSEQVLEIFV